MRPLKFDNHLHVQAFAVARNAEKSMRLMLYGINANTKHLDLV